MSLNLVKNNSSSPFRLQRSMVDQGGEGGAYESGGYTGQSQHPDSGIGDMLASFGKVVGAGIGSITEGDKNKFNEKKVERLKDREKKIDKKTADAFDKGDDKKVNKLMKRHDRVDTRLKDTKSEIKKYNESEKLTLKSDIKKDNKEVKPVVESAATAKITKDRKSSITTNTIDTSNLIDPNKTPGTDAWNILKSQSKI